MRFFKRLFKLLFFTLFVGLLAGIVFAWTNIWVPQNSLAILNISSDFNFTSKKETQENKSFVITRKGFNWHWQRIIPGWTQLIIFSTDIQSFTLNNSFDLPNASVYAANNSRISVQDFIVNLQMDFSYSLDKEKIINYVKNNKITNVYTAQELILNSFKQDITKIMQTEIVNFSVSNTFSNASLNPNLVQETITSNIGQKLQDYKTNNTLPIVVYESSVSITNTPNFALYTLLQQNYINETTLGTNNQPINTEFTNKTKSLEYYIYFIQELGKVVEKNPSLTEIIKILPPKEVISLEN